MSDSVIRVLLVDDDPLVRSGLALILGGASDLDVVGQAGDGREALTLLETTSPDVILMDIRMPVLDGIATTEEIKRRPDGPHVIVLTTFGADEHVVSALRAGADGFLLKDTAPPQIVESVRRVVAGEPIVSPAVLTTLIDRVRDGGPDTSSLARERLDGLTGRELDIARAVGRGLSNAEIAAELYLSVPTVKAHVGRVLAKLEVDNRVQVALVVHDAGE